MQKAITTSFIEIGRNRVSELSPTGRMTVQIECTVKGNYMEVEIYEDRYVIYCERDQSEQTVYNDATVVSTIKKKTPIKFLNIFRLRSIW